ACKPAISASPSWLTSSGEWPTLTRHLDELARSRAAAVLAQRVEPLDHQWIVDDPANEKDLAYEASSAALRHPGVRYRRADPGQGTGPLKGAAMPDMHAPHAGWKRTLIHELVEYWLNVAYLSFFLVAFVWYRRLILAEYQVLYTNYWFPLIEAAVLAKVIMIGDVLRLGRGLEHKPLIVPTLIQTLVFGAWVAAFHVLEATVRALIQGKG